MTLVRVELLSADADIEIKIGDRTFKLSRPDHVTVDIERSDDVLSVRATKLAQNAEKYRHVPAQTEPDFPPRPPSYRAGVAKINADGVEEYQSINRNL